MTLLDRLLGHDHDTTVELLRFCLTVGGDVMDREFDIGHRTLRGIFVHMIRNVEVWTALAKGDAVGKVAGDTSVASLVGRFEAAYADFASLARAVEQAGKLDELFTDTLDRPPTPKSLGGAIGHVITHNMHHRAGVLHVLRRLGLPGVPEGDLMGWDLRARA